VVIGGDVVAWVTKDSIEGAESSETWDFIRTSVTRGVFEWYRAKDWTFTIRDSDSGHLCGISEQAAPGKAGRADPEQVPFSVADLSAGGGPVTVWDKGWPGMEPGKADLQRIVDKAKGEG